MFDAFTVSIFVLYHWLDEARKENRLGKKKSNQTNGGIYFFSKRKSRNGFVCERFGWIWGYSQCAAGQRKSVISMAASTLCSSHAEEWGKEQIGNPCFSQKKVFCIPKFGSPGIEIVFSIFAQGKPSFFF